MLGLTVFTAPGGDFVADWSRRVYELTIETGDHGYHSMTGSVGLTLAESFNIYNDHRGAMHIVLSDGAIVQWEGRIEDIQIVAGGIRFGALGYWRALFDAPYTALWSDSSVANFRILTNSDNVNDVPAAYETDNNNRLYIAPRNGEDYAGNSKRCVWAYQIPSQSGRQIVAVDYSYVLDAPADWRLSIINFSSSWGVTAIARNITSTGSALSGTASDTFTATDRIGFRLIYNAASATYTGQTGAAYCRLTGIRVKTTTAATITAPAVVADLISHIGGINSGTISTATAEVEDPGVDLDQAIYLDAMPADIIKSLAAIGDDSDPPVRYEAGIYEDRRLFFRPAGSAARAWYVDITAPDMQRSLESLINSAYGVYDGGKYRTATAEDDQSIDENNITRRAAVQATTTSATTAAVYRDAAIEAGKNGRGRAAIRARRLFDENGAPWPAWAVRAGDTITIRNLPPDLANLDNTRRFTLAGTRYDVLSGELTLIPAELPTLESLIGG